MSDEHTSLISKVEATIDVPGWMVYFDEDKGFERIPEKYSAHPHIGDTITLYGYPFTRGIKINEQIIYMNSALETSNYFELMWSCVSTIREFEQAIEELEGKLIN